MGWSIEDDAQLFVQNQHFAELRAEASRRRQVREARQNAQRHPLARRFAALLSAERDGATMSGTLDPCRVISIERARPIPLAVPHPGADGEELSSA